MSLTIRTYLPFYLYYYLFYDIEGLNIFLKLVFLFLCVELPVVPKNSFWYFCIPYLLIEDLVSLNLKMC